MTRTTPRRRIILQLRHIFLTDALTFIADPRVIYLRPCPRRLAFFSRPSY